EAMMPGVRPVGDALATAGDERLHLPDIGAALRRMWRYDDQPALDIERHEGLRRELVTLEKFGAQRPVGRLGLDADRQARSCLRSEVAECVFVVLAASLVRHVDHVAERGEGVAGERLRNDLHDLPLACAQPSLPIATAVSAMRLEKPHSLSYQLMTRTRVPS